MAHKRGAACFGRGKPPHGGHENADIPRRRTKLQPGQSFLDLGKHLGIRGCDIVPVKNLIADLQIFVRPVLVEFLTAEHLARIGIARRFRPLGHVHLHHRNGEIRA